MISIIFTRSPGIASRLVRSFTGSKVSHVGVAFGIDGIRLVVHAYGRGGVQVQRARPFLFGRTIVAEFAVLAPVSLGPLLDDLGDKYDVESILRHAARRLGIWSRSPSYSPNALVCSELVAQLPLRAFSDLNPETATPEDLLRRCLDSSEVARLS